MLFILYIIAFPLLPLYKLCVLFVLTLMRFYKKIFTKQNWFDYVDNQIMLGGAPLFIFQDDDFLDDNHISAVLRICPESPPYDKKYFKQKNNFLSLIVFDRTAPSMRQLQKGVMWMDEKIKDGEKVLVHCALGAMRSATFVIAWYMYAKGWDLQKAYDHVKKQRPQIHPNTKQMRVLKEFEKTLRD